MRPLNITEFAKERGVSRARVYQWLEDGRIARLPDGSIDADEAHGRLGELLDHAKGIRRDGNVTSSGPAPNSAPDLLQATERRDEQGTGAGPRDESGYWEHRTRQAKADAQLKEMQVQERAGNLVRADEVSAEISAAFRMTRNALQGMVDQLAPVLDPASPSRAHKLLTQHVEKTLRELSDRLADRAAGTAATSEREAALQ